MEAFNFDYYYWNTGINIVGGILLVVLLSMLARRDGEVTPNKSRVRRITSIMLVLIGSISIIGSCGVLFSGKATNVNFVLEDRLRELKGLKGLSIDEINKWKEFNQHKIAGKSYAQRDRIYKNQQFINKFGEEIFNRLEVEERDELFRNRVIQEKTYQVFHKDSNFHVIDNMTIEGKYNLLKSGYTNEEEEARKQRALQVTQVYQEGTRTLFLFGFTLLAWGFYAVCFRKSNISRWKRGCKVLAYIILTLAYSNISDYHHDYEADRSFRAYFLLTFHIIAIVLLLLLSHSGKQRHLHPSRFSPKGVLFKLVGSIGITAVLFMLLLFVNKSVEMFFLLFVYILYYLSYEIYYIYLIWRKKEVKGEDVLLLPFLNKLGIYKAVLGKDKKKKLLKTVLPILIISVLPPILALIFDGYRSYGLAAFTLFLPFIAWIIFFIYAYSSTWLSSDKISLVISTEDEETKLNYGYRNEFSSPTMYYSKPLQGTGYISDLSNTEMLETTSYDGCTLDDFMPHSQKECASNFYIYLIYRNCNLDNPLALEIKRRYEEAAHDGIYEAYNNLGVLQQKLENYGESVRYFKKAIEKGSFYAYVNLATHYCVQKEWNNFFKYNELAMETNNPKAIFNQAIAHHFGLNTDKNITKALSLYRRLLNLQPNDIKYNMEVTQEDTDIFKYYRLLTRHNLALMFIAGEIGEEWLEEFPLIRCNLRYILNADRKAYAKKYGDLILHGRDCYELSNEALANEELQDMEYRLRKYYTSKNEY